MLRERIAHDRVGVVNGRRESEPRNDGYITRTVMEDHLIQWTGKNADYDLARRVDAGRVTLARRSIRIVVERAVQERVLTGRRRGKGWSAAARPRGAVERPRAPGTWWKANPACDAARIVERAHPVEVDIR